MDGELALKYARSRHTTSDFDRSKRQMQIILACRDKALKVDMISKLPQLYSQFQSLIQIHSGRSSSPCQPRAHFWKPLWVNAMGVRTLSSPAARSTCGCRKPGRGRMNPRRPVMRSALKIAIFLIRRHCPRERSSLTSEATRLPPRVSKSAHFILEKRMIWNARLAGIL